MRKRFDIMLLISIFTVIIGLNGCWDYQDINKQSLGVSVGIDLENGNIVISGENASLVPESGKGAEKAEVTNVYIYMAKGKDFEEARSDYDRKVPFPDFSGATRVVVFSRSFAEGGITPYLNRIDKLRGYRKTVLLTVSRESPLELFNTKVKNDISVGFYIEDMIKYLSGTGNAIYKNVGDALTDAQFTQAGYLLPYIGKEQDAIKYLGLAVMKDSRLAGIIPAEESKGVLYLIGENILSSESFPSPSAGTRVSMELRRKGKRIKTEYTGGRIVIDVDLKMEAQLQYRYVRVMLDEEDIRQLEETISDRIKQDITEIIRKSQEEFKCDIFRFARHFKGDHSHIFEQIDWAGQYPDAVINVRVSTNIASTNFLDTEAQPKY